MDFWKPIPGYWIQHSRDLPYYWWSPGCFGVTNTTVRAQRTIATSYRVDFPLSRISHCAAHLFSITVQVSLGLSEGVAYETFMMGMSSGRVNKALASRIKIEFNKRPPAGLTLEYASNCFDARSTLCAKLQFLYTDCRMKPFNPEQLISSLKNRTIWFIGDYHSYQQYQVLDCMLSRYLTICAFSEHEKKRALNCSCVLIQLDC